MADEVEMEWEECKEEDKDAKMKEIIKAHDHYD